MTSTIYSIKWGTVAYPLKKKHSFIFCSKGNSTFLLKFQPNWISIQINLFEKLLRHVAYLSEGLFSEIDAYIVPSSFYSVSSGTIWRIWSSNDNHTSQSARHNGKLQTNRPWFARVCVYDENKDEWIHYEINLSETKSEPSRATRLSPARSLLPRALFIKADSFIQLLPF